MSVSHPVSEHSPAYRELTRELREIATLVSVERVLSWDQETKMPQGGGDLRADQISLLSGLAHQRHTAPRLGDLISECEADSELMGDAGVAANVHGIRRDYDRATKLPESLVREFTLTASHSLQAWKQARSESDFASVAPRLERLVELARARAESFGPEFGATPYDRLLGEYEPGMKATEVDQVFDDLRPRLTALIAAIDESGVRPGTAVHEAAFPVDRQIEFSRRVLARMGFDFSQGRLDLSTHPFCSGIGPGDTRLTSRYEETGLLDGVSSAMHEGGHALYDQGLPMEQYFGQPLGEAASFGIHESQSRLWENLVGRSRPFWEWALPVARDVFGDAMSPFDVDAMYGAANRVEPSLIRVDSDEATYNLHIMLRFDLERAMLSGDLAVADLPGAWNERIRADLGLEVPDDRRGCLQDIHWYMGYIGYFPTYTLGSLYAAQLWETVNREISDLDDQVRTGDFSTLLQWLRENIHRHGRRYSAPELCARVTGERLSPVPLIRYLSDKYRPLYNL